MQPRWQRYISDVVVAYAALLHPLAHGEEHLPRPVLRVRRDDQHLVVVQNQRAVVELPGATRDAQKRRSEAALRSGAQNKRALRQGRSLTWLSA